MQKANVEVSISEATILMLLGKIGLDQPAILNMILMSPNPTAYLETLLGVYQEPVLTPVVLDTGYNENRVLYLKSFNPYAGESERVTYQYEEEVSTLLYFSCMSSVIKEHLDYLLPQLKATFLNCPDSEARTLEVTINDEVIKISNKNFDGKRDYNRFQIGETSPTYRSCSLKTWEEYKPIEQ